MLFLLIFEQPFLRLTDHFRKLAHDLIVGSFEVAAGIILVGSSPSGLASNVMSFIAKANLALSVTLTAVATMLAPLITPSLMKLLAGQFVPIDFWGMMLSIINIVILPIVAGLMFNAMAYGKESRKSQFIQGLVP